MPFSLSSLVCFKEKSALFYRFIPFSSSLAFFPAKRQKKVPTQSGISFSFSFWFSFDSIGKPLA